MYFITNKKVVSKKDGKLIFEDSNELSQNLRYCRMLDKRHFVEIESGQFMSEIMECKEYNEVLFYVHGFDNQPYTDVLPRAKSIQTQLVNESIDNMRVIPIIWPCDDDFGIIKDYWDDQESAESSGQFLSRTISKLVGWQDINLNNPCTKRMHVLAHSMGARVLMKCLSHWAEKFGGGGVPYLFKNVFLMASDIPNESLERNEEGKHITQAAQRVICYYANDDFSMPASKVANTKNAVFSRRIGHTGPEDMSRVPNNVYSVNCDSFNNEFDPPKGHSYFLDKGAKKSPAFQHMVEVLKTKKPKLAEKERELPY